MDHRQALSGVKVLDFTWAGAGPRATKYLADHGAEVVKVESARHPDVVRVSAPYKAGIVDPNASGMFPHFNTSKKGMALDLRHPRGMEVAERLVQWSDLVVENFAPGVLRRLGLGYDRLVELKPEIIMLSMSIPGQTGPSAGMSGWGHMASAVAGHTYMSGWPDRGPVTPGSVVYGDVIVALVAVFAAIAALDGRLRTGRGQYIDIAQLEVMVHLIAPAILDHLANGRQRTREGNRCEHAAPHGVFRCKGEERWCAVAVSRDEEWKSLCGVLGNPEWSKGARFASLSSRKENEDELERLVEEWTVNYSAPEVMAMLQAAGVPAGVVQDAEDLIDRCPQLKDRGLFLQLEHPVMGVCNHPREPFILSETPGEIRTSPCLGEHNEEVLCRILGMSDREFVELQTEGICE